MAEGTPREIEQLPGEPIPKEQARAFGSVVLHLFDKDIQALRHDPRIHDAASPTHQMRAASEDMNTMIMLLKTAEIVSIEKNVAHDKNPHTTIHFSQKTERSFPHAGTTTVEGDTFQNLVQAFQENFGTTIDAAANTTDVLPYHSLQKKMYALQSWDGIQVTITDAGEKTFSVKKHGETLYEPLTDTAVPTTKLPEESSETELDQTPVTLPPEIPRILADWMHNHLTSFTHLPMGHDDMREAVDQLEDVLTQLVTADDVTLKPLNDNHGWAFETTGDGKAPPVDLKPQKITLFRPASDKLKLALVNTFSNPLSIIKGYAELEITKGNESYRELLENTTAMEKAIKELSNTSDDLDFSIEQDKAVTITPHPNPIS